MTEEKNIKWTSASAMSFFIAVSTKYKIICNGKLISSFIFNPKAYKDTIRDAAEGKYQILSNKMFQLFLLHKTRRISLLKHL